VGLCGDTGFDSKLYVYASNAGGCPAVGSDDTGLQIACDDDGCPSPAGIISRIRGLVVQAGVQYWIVVDGSGNSCGNYFLEITYCPTCTSDTQCADGVFCNGQEVCNLSLQACQPGSPPDCSDANPCTADSCDQTSDACVNTPIPSCCTNDCDCDDRVLCNGLEFCSLFGDCEPGGPPCEDGNPCTDDICGEATVSCTHSNNTAPCDDGRPCTTGDTCSGGICSGTGIPGCCFTDADCDDGVFCNGPEVCDPQSGCQPAAAVACDDGDSCTADTCDEFNEACEYTEILGCCTDDLDCDDDNECTADACKPVTLCENDICQTMYRCENRLSSGAPCGNQGNTACTDPDTCDTTGVCQPNHAQDGTPCNDGDLCTENDACLGGVCAGTPNGLCAVCLQTGPPGDPKNQLSFQALLKDSNGYRVQGPVNLAFQIYDLPGQPVGAPITLNAVPVADGIVSTAIPIQNGVFDGTGRMLGVSVNGTPEMTPRIPLSSAPQSFRVNCAASPEIVDHLELGNAERSGTLRIFGAGADHSICLGGDCPASAASGTGSVAGVIEVLCSGMATFSNNADENTITLNPCTGAISLFTPGPPEEHAETVLLSAGTGFNGALLQLAQRGGEKTITLDADVDNAAELTLADATGIGIKSTIKLDARVGRFGGAQALLYNRRGDNTIQLNADILLTSAIQLLQSDGDPAIDLSAQFGGTTGGAEVRLYNPDANPNVILRAHETTGPAGEARGGAALYLRDTNNRTTIDMDAEAGGGGAGIKLRDAAGAVSITLDGNDGNGDGRIITDVLQITGGCDLSEPFDIKPIDRAVEPGMVVSIDPQRPGKLVVSNKAYDRTVAGIVSGAGGIKPGMLMGQSASVGDGEHPVALTGRVYCWADASNDPIEPGDLLTTSDVPGHAMKVTDYAKAHGAILGKAMSSLESGKGLVLVLVSLQ